MKYLLRIGNYDYLLPDSRGLSTVMETLSRARTLDFANRKYDSHGKMVGFRHGPGPEVEVKPLTGGWNTRKACDDGAECVECEVLPPVKAIGAPGRGAPRPLDLIGRETLALPGRAGGVA